MIIKVESVEHLVAIALQHNTIKSAAFQAIDLKYVGLILKKKNYI